MIPENGIDLVKCEGQNTTVFQKGETLQLVSDLTFTSDRKISGCAHFPSVDKEREIILGSAVEKALPGFMEHPVLHLQHTERPVGVISKAEVKDGALYIEASIFEKDTDDVWEEIQKGSLNKFSIFGKRESSSIECGVDPALRLSPCVTKALTLWSISIVGNNAINEKTFLEVVKSFCPKYKKDDIYIKAENTDSTPMYTKVDDKMDEKEEVEKSVLEVEPTNTSSMMDRLSKIEQTLTSLVESDKQVHDSMNKGEETMEEKKEEEVEKCGQSVVKAEEVAVTDSTISKAALDEFKEWQKASIADIKKALDSYETLKKSHDELVVRIESIEKQKIEKGGNIVILSEDGKVFNPHLANLAAMGD